MMMINCVTATPVNKHDKLARVKVSNTLNVADTCHELELDFNSIDSVRATDGGNGASSQPSIVHEKYA